MVLLAFVLSLLRADPIAQIDALSKKRDLDGMLAHCSASLKDPVAALGFLKQNGVFEVGRNGWSAHSLDAPGGSKRYVVFSTALTSEDIGEQVFEWDGAKLTRYVPEQEDFGARLERQSLQIWFDIPKRSVRIDGTVQIRRQRSAPPIFLMRLSPNYKVSSIQTETGAATPFRQAGGVVCVQSPKEDSFSLRIRYSAVVDQPRYAGSINSDEAILTNDYWYPMIARRPCAFDLTVHSPKGWAAVGQGEEVSMAETAAGRVTRFRMDLPVIYWSLSAAPYRTASDTLNGLKYGIWSLTLPQEKLALQAELFRPIVAFFSKSFAPYPFTRWGAVDSPHYGGGALEAYSFATYGSGWLPDEDPHEPAHTWWGGIINNTYLKSLWNESFAVYSEGLYRREAPIGNREERRPAFVADCFPGETYRRAPLSDSGASLGPIAAALGYGKGGMVLQVLESELGTETMLKTMREWLATHPKGEPGEWEDYERAAGRAAGRSLKTFFDEWVRRPGWPSFDVEGLRFETGVLTGEAVFSGDSYRLTCELMLQYLGGRRTFHRLRLEPGSNGRAPFRLDTGDAQKPELASFDPWRRLMRRYGSDETPTEIRTVLRACRRFQDPKRPDWMKGTGPSRALEKLPENLNQVFLVGSPDTLPELRELCRRAGFVVQGGRLLYDGTAVDLSNGGALAVVDLAGGGQCVIGLGKTVVAPNFGRARLAVFDRYGRFLRGATEPKTKGFLAYGL